jgi:hypothetical protein
MGVPQSLMVYKWMIWIPPWYPHDLGNLHSSDGPTFICGMAKRGGSHWPGIFLLFDTSHQSHPWNDPEFGWYLWHKSSHDHVKTGSPLYIWDGSSSTRNGNDVPNSLRWFNVLFEQTNKKHQMKVWYGSMFKVEDPVNMQMFVVVFFLYTLHYWQLNWPTS